MKKAIRERDDKAAQRRGAANGVRTRRQSTTPDRSRFRLPKWEEVKV